MPRSGVIIGYGHSPEYACLYSEEAGVLISGDQLLPRITPNISVWPQEPEANPLRLYLDSLPRFRELPAAHLAFGHHGLGRPNALFGIPVGILLAGNRNLNFSGGPGARVAR